VEAEADRRITAARARENGVPPIATFTNQVNAEVFKFLWRVGDVDGSPIALATPTQPA
jgi:hypothetical protein